MEYSALNDYASDFASELNETLEKVLGQTENPYLEVRAYENHVLVSARDSEGIQLWVNGHPAFRLQVRFNCFWNSTKQYLAINHSSYQIAVNNYPEPVLRFDFLSDARDVPISHINIHSHHPGLQRAMASAKPNSRAFKAADDTSALHIPTGGSRFRPTLEDVLEMLIRDFKIDVLQTWKLGLSEGRKEFRNSQLAAAIRDNPDEAVRALEALGYAVTWEQNSPEPEARDLKRGAY